MKKFLNSRQELEDFLKTYNPVTDERLLFEVSPEKTYIIYPEDYIKWDGKWCKYLGLISDFKTIPNIFAFYKNGRKVYYHKAKYESIDMSEIKENKYVKEDKSDFLEVPIKENDNELMVMSKEMLKGIRTNTFKSMFKSQSDYNNVRREITNGNGRLSWDRFILICELLGFEHEVKVYKDGLEFDSKK